MKQGEILYEIALKDIINRFRIPAVTTNIQLEEIGEKLFGLKFNGVVPIDHYTGEQGYWIVNTDTSDKAGEHWFGVIIDKNGNELVYDSFGRKIGGSDITYTESDAEQEMTEENCGARTLAFLLVYDIGGRNLAKDI